MLTEAKKKISFPFFLFFLLSLPFIYSPFCLLLSSPSSFLFFSFVLRIWEISYIVSGISALGISSWEKAAYLLFILALLACKTDTEYWNCLMLTVGLFWTFFIMSQEDSSMTFSMYVIFLNNRIDKGWLGPHGLFLEVTTWALIRDDLLTYQVLRTTVLGGWTEATKYPLHPLLLLTCLAYTLVNHFSLP